MVFGPHFQRRKLHDLQGAKDFFSVFGPDPIQGEEGLHASVVEPSAPGHASAPLGLQSVPEAPSRRVVRPQKYLVLAGKRRRLFERQAKGCQALVDDLSGACVGMVRVIRGQLVARPQTRELC